MNNQSEQKANTFIQGYMEGYYGKLFSWCERDQLLNFISSLQQNTYCYAPKEDPWHRLHWREAYDIDWRKAFSQFCAQAKDVNISVVAGIAPGLDFRFDQKNQAVDFEHLYQKAKCLIDDGAAHIMILWDDIDENNEAQKYGLNEGTAHAQVVNRLSEKLDSKLWTVPRIYSAEIEDKTNYLDSFIEALNAPHTLLICGDAIVVSDANPQNLIRVNSHRQLPAVAQHLINSEPKHKVVLWDNFYANDYCPRRLYLGPWTGREKINDYVLNPTGLPYTDRLLLDIASSTHTSNDKQATWRQALDRHGVPDAFHDIAPFFTHPFFGNRTVHGDIRDIDFVEPTDKILQAIETCLWKWKTPLSREWYPFIFGLKHDIALAQGKLPRHRIVKTQPPVLAKRLLS